MTDTTVKTTLPLADTHSALAMLDEWAEGNLPDDALMKEPPAVSQRQMRQLWDIIDNPRGKQVLRQPVEIPR